MNRRRAVIVWSIVLMLILGLSGCGGGAADLISGAPVILNVNVAVTDTTAIITWSTTEYATTQAEYGEADEYSTATPLDEDLVSDHGVVLNNLTPDTTYHYSLRSKDEAGDEAVTEDSTFKTLPSIPVASTDPPVITSVFAMSFVDTEAMITWATDVPATTQVEYGTSDSYGSASTLDSTLMYSHMATLSGLTPGTIYHYRVKSKNADGDETISINYTCTTSGTSVVIPEPPLILNIEADVTTTTATITWNTTENATTQIEWGTTASYGTTTTLDTTLVANHSVTLTELTPNTMYHYRARSMDVDDDEAVSIDYTFTTASDTGRVPEPPLILGVGAEVTSTTATITWSTTEAATTQIDWGTTAAYGTTTTLDETLAADHSVSLSGLTPDTEYHYRTRSKDVDDDEAVSSDQTFTTSSIPGPTTNPLVMDYIYAFPGSTTARVQWDTTYDSTSQVEYGTTTAYGLLSAFDDTLTDDHSVSITGLTHNTTYHFRVLSKDIDGRDIASMDYTFTTNNDPGAPTISSVSASVGSATATITWDTNEFATTRVEWGTTTAYGTTLTHDSGTSHSVDITGLEPNTTYHYRVRSTDIDDDEAVSIDYTFTTNGLFLCVYGGNICLVGTGDSDITELTDTGDNNYPRLSPDGTKIAFRSDRDGNAEIYVMNADGSGQTRLTNNSAYDSSIEWSPDGSKMAFFSDRDGNREIYVMNADGSSQTRLTNNAVWDVGATWSPDGTKIAYMSDDPPNFEIYVMNADGTGQTNLTNNAVYDAIWGWSPDGTKILFNSNRDGNYEIYVMNADGSGQTRLTNDSGHDTAYGWSPDGTKIAFYSDRDGNNEIYVMNADGSGQTRLTNNSVDDEAPVWSPDGTKIAFRSYVDSEWEIYVMNADGSGLYNHTANVSGDCESVSWWP